MEITGPQGPELRGDFDPWSFEHQLDLMRAHGLDATAGIAGRFQVTAVDDLDTGGHVDWGNGGSVVWIYPNRRGPETDWARFSMDEVLEDFLAIWAVHRVDNA